MTFHLFDASDRHRGDGFDRLVYDPAPELEAIDRRRVIDRAVSDLPPRARQVIALRFGLDGAVCTLDEVGWLLRVTAERVRQIQHRALQQLRRSSGASGIADYAPEVGAS